MKRFPVGLTIAAIVVFALLVSLGLWQLRRLDETNAHRARLAALVHAPATPLAPLLERGGALDHTRVTVACAASAAPATVSYRYSVIEGALGWRLLSLCPLDAGPYDSILIDRGRIAALEGVNEPAAMAFPQPVAVTGILRGLGGATLVGDTLPSSAAAVFQVRVVDRDTLARLARLGGGKAPAPYYVVAESETPPPAGIRPAPVAEDLPRDNFQYALTWFGLAAALAWVYAAMLWRRLKGQ